MFYPALSLGSQSVQKSGPLTVGAVLPLAHDRSEIAKILEMSFTQIEVGMMLENIYLHI